MISRRLKVLLSNIFFKTRKNITLGKDTYIGMGSTILGTPFTFGDYGGVDKIYVIGSQPTYIGRYCAIASNLTIVTSNHFLNKPNIQAKLQNELFSDSMDDISKGGVTIGNNVWIGINVTVLPGVTIGDGAVIGAGSVISKSIPPFTIAVGNPARVIRKRFSEKTIRKLMKDPWWEWDREKIKQNKKFFVTPLQ